MRKPILTAAGIVVVLFFVVAISSAYPDYHRCGSVDIFFHNASSDISTYNIMDHYPEMSDQKSLSATVSTGTGDKTVGTWISPQNQFGTQYIYPGLWRFRIYAYSTSTSGTNTLKFYAINRSANGVETDLFFGKAITEDIDSTSPREYLFSYARRNYTTIFPGDRLVIRVVASTNSAAARDITMEVSGNTNASMVQIGNFYCPDEPSLNEDITKPIIGGILGAMLCLYVINVKRKQG